MANERLRGLNARQHYSVPRYSRKLPPHMSSSLHLQSLSMENSPMTIVKIDLDDFRNVEQAEVLVSNLLALKHPLESHFVIPFDDIVVSLETVLQLLKKAQSS